jgi:uncharacterized protein (DUF1697 family)
MPCWTLDYAHQGQQPVSAMYVALLRGIGPLNPNMRNEKLRGVFEALGFRRVETVMTTGNVVFEADLQSEADTVATMEARVEEALPAMLGFRSTTIIRTRDQIRELVESKPFGDRMDTPATSLEVTFLKHEAAMAVQVPHRSPAGDYTIVRSEDRAICSVIDRSTSGTSNVMRWLEKTFGKEITTRGWRTVQRIDAKLR